MAHHRIGVSPASFQDLTGIRYGRLVVIKRGPNGKSGMTKWECRCDCGKTTIVFGAALRGGDTKSCGCLHAEWSAKYHTIHGKCGTVEHQIWKSIIGRCENANSTSFPRYGGRGIKICPEWRHDFAAFLAHVGPRPSPKHSIDRYPNNDGNYEPGNVRWATVREQSRNRRSNVLLTHNGITATVIEWAEITGFNHMSIRRRIYAGWSHSKALTTPMGPPCGRHRKSS